MGSIQNNNSLVKSLREFKAIYLANFIVRKKNAFKFRDNKTQANIYTMHMDPLLEWLHMRAK